MAKVTMVIKPLNELRSKSFEDARIEASIAHMQGLKTLGVMVSTVSTKLRSYYVDGHIATTLLTKEDIENAFMYSFIQTNLYSTMRAAAKTHKQLFKKENDNWKITDKRIYSNDLTQDEWVKWLSKYTTI